MVSYAEEAIQMMSKKEAQTVACLVPHILHVKIKALSEREQCTVSDVVRTALQLFFKQLNEAEGHTP